MKYSPVKVWYMCTWYVVRGTWYVVVCVWYVVHTHTYYMYCRL